MTNEENKRFFELFEEFQKLNSEWHSLKAIYKDAKDYDKLEDFSARFDKIADEDRYWVNKKTIAPELNNLWCIAFDARLDANEFIMDKIGKKMAAEDKVYNEAHKNWWEEDED